MKFRIHSILTTQSPLHIAAPGNLRFDLKTGTTFYGGDNEGMPCNGIQRLPCIVNGEKSGPGNPVIASNNINGRLRRHVARTYLRALKARGQKLSLPTYSVLMCGAATGNPDSQELTFADYQRVIEHPYLGLFGGGPKMLRRNVRVHNAMPINPITNELRGKLRHPAANDYVQSPQWITAAWAFRRNDDLRQMMDLDIAETSIENFHEVFNARQLAILDEKKNNKEGGDKGLKSTTFTYSALEFVLPGVNFDLLFELDVRNDAQMGLFLLALASFVDTERLGGWSRNGFGAFALNDVRLVDEAGVETEIFNDGTLLINEPLVARFIAAWSHAAAHVVAAELEGLVKVPEAKPSKEKKAKAWRGHHETI